jgi:hypothetical protein
MIGGTTITLDGTLRRETFPGGPMEDAAVDNAWRRRKREDFLPKRRYVMDLVGVTGGGPLLSILLGEGGRKEAGQVTYWLVHVFDNCVRRQAGMDPCARLLRAIFAVLLLALLAIRDATCGWSTSPNVRPAWGQARPRLITYIMLIITDPHRWGHRASALREVRLHAIPFKGYMVYLVIVTWRGETPGADPTR